LPPAESGGEHELGAWYESDVPEFVAPQVLVLGGGGILGEAWMSAVLVGLEDAAGFEARQCEGYVGTSAGSIVAAVLAAGVDPRARLGQLPEQPPAEPSDVEDGPGLLGRGLRLGLAAGGSVGAPLAAAGLRSTEAAGALVRRAAPEPSSERAALAGAARPRA
jgi:NTE family protein